MNQIPQDVEKTAMAGSDFAETTQMYQPQENRTQFAAGIECPVCRTQNPPTETYCQDCGFLLATQPVEIGELPEAKSFGKLAFANGSREFALKLGENTIGRESSDVLLADPAVSRKHAVITVEENAAYVSDVGSANGTVADAAKLASGDKYQLKDGSELVFGSCVLKYSAPEVQADAEPDQAAEATVITQPDSAEPAELSEPEAAAEVVDEPAAPAAVAKLVSKDGAHEFDILGGTNTLGRRQGDNMIVVPDPYCSGRHAEIASESGKITITDIGSTNGTLVNGVRLDANVPRELIAGDEITIGGIVLKLEIAQ